MKTIKISLIVFLVFSLFNIYGQSSNYSSIASKMVNISLDVQPGESVIISGTTAELEIMEELYVEVSKAGGKPTIEINIPMANKRAIMNTSEEYLKMPDIYNVIKFKSVDCFISVGSIAEPGLFSDVPEEKFAAIRQANQLFTSVYQNAGFRQVSLGQVGGIPTEAYAKTVGANYDEMLKMFWNSVDIDYDAMLEKGQNLIKNFKAGSLANLESKYGTDLTFKIGEVAPRTNCGKTDETINSKGPSASWLPAGEAYVVLDPTSASGTLVVPNTRYRNKDIKNLKMIFKDGKMSSMTADGNLDDLKKAMELSTGMKDVLSYIDIGINPNSNPLSGSTYLSFEMAGVVTLGIGANTWAGGDVESDFGTQFFLPNTTLTVNNTQLVVDGVLK